MGRTNVLSKRVDDGTVVRSVYGLYGPDQAIRYIGLTTQTIERRLDAHRRTSRRLSVDHPVYAWIRELGELNVHTRLLCTTDTDQELRLAEQRIIAEYFAAGFDLLNRTRGGDGSWNFSDETRQRISEGVKRGRKSWEFSDEHRRNLGLVQRGRVSAEESRARCSATAQGLKDKDAWKTVLASWEACSRCGERFAFKQLRHHKRHNRCGKSLYDGMWPDN